jgi:hypothetical protein
MCSVVRCLKIRSQFVIWDGISIHGSTTPPFHTCFTLLDTCKSYFASCSYHSCMHAFSCYSPTTPTYWFGSCGHSPSIYRTPLDTTALGALLPVTAWMCCLMHGRACATTTLPVIVTEETSLFFLLLLSLTLKNN